MNKESLITFPCEFPVKVMGPHTSVFFQEVIQIVQTHCKGFSEDQCKHSVSKSATYVSITVTVMVDSQQRLDALYQSLCDHPDTKMVL